LVDRSLSIPYQGVQGAHAVAQWLLEHKDSQTWDNGTLVFVSVDNVEEWHNKLDYLGMDHSYFLEPDVDNLMTALACYTDDKRIFRKLKLMGSS